jgi:hypothetical protein
MNEHDATKDTSGVQGEGNYDAAREYNERTRRFVESGRVGEAAQEAEPRSPEEAEELKEAEEAGKRRAKDRPQDPAPD